MVVFLFPSDRFFPDSPLKQGLDLKGGMHIVLELDVPKAMDIYLSDQAKEAIISALRSEKGEKVFPKSVQRLLSNQELLIYSENLCP